MTPMDPAAYAMYCAPTTLAALCGVRCLDASIYLTETGHNDGSGGTTEWEEVLRGLGGVSVDVTDPDGDARKEEAVLRYCDGRRKYFPTPSLGLYTVAGFLRAHPEGLYVLWTTEHTLLVEGGKVIADTQHTNSMRARVHAAFRFDSRPTLPKKTKRRSK